jgi:hypothetical protein
MRKAKLTCLHEDHNSTEVWLHYETQFQLFEWNVARNHQTPHIRQPAGLKTERIPYPLI